MILRQMINLISHPAYLPISCSGCAYLFKPLISFTYETNSSINFVVQIVLQLPAMNKLQLFLVIPAQSVIFTKTCFAVHSSVKEK